MAAGEMGKFIEQADKDKIELANLKQKQSELEKKFDDVSSKYNELKTKEKELANKENDLKNKEEIQKEIGIKFEIEALKYQLKSEKESKNEIFKLVETLVKNPRSIEMATSNKSIPVYVPYPGGGGYHEIKQQTDLISTEKTETKD